MTVGAIVQARMSSARLPGKVLRPLAETPLLGWVLAGLARVGELDEIVVATSMLSTDDPIADFVQGSGLPLFRGPLEDVAARVLGAADRFGIDTIVRVSADSPLLQADVVDRVLVAYRDEGPELATNVFPRSFPRGQSAEVFARDTLARVHDRMDDEQQEHVTRWFYDNEGQVAIANVAWEADVSDLRHCVDTLEDAEAVERLLIATGRRPWDAGLDRLIALSQELDLGT